MSLRFLAATPLLLVAALASACSNDAGGESSRMPAAPETLVLVTIDTLRADHVGSYGYWIDTTPFLDRLSREGARFTHAYAQTGTTQPSHASIFTSLYPLQHGVLRNGHVLDPGFRTLAEAMAEAGRATAAFTSTNAHFSWGGLSQGFEVYDEQPPAEADAAPYRDGAATVDAALAWFDRARPQGPLFLWVHLFDPHRPFRPPPDHLLATMPRGAPPRRAQARRLREEHRLAVGADDRLLRQIARYDAEIRHADAQLRRLFDGLTERGRGEDAVWVVTADHGQGLENHGWFGHSKQIYDVQLHVPLILWARDGRFGHGRVVERAVEHVDLTPTLLQIADLDPGAELPETARGASLVPLLGFGGEYAKRHAFAQRSSYPPSRRQRNPGLVPGRNYALREGNRKLLWYAEGPDELYATDADPYETRDLLADEPGIAAAMGERLRGMARALDAGVQAEEVPEEVRARLRALGYVQ